MSDQIQLAPLREAELPLLREWLNAPHMFPFYMREEMSFTEVRDKFVPRVAMDYPVRCMIAWHADQPYGYVQWYFVRSFPTEPIAQQGICDGISLDYFVGDPAYIGKGMGSAMLRSLFAYVVPIVPRADRIFFLYHEDANTRAIACSRRAGFIPIKSFTHKDKPSTLFRTAQNFGAPA